MTAPTPRFRLESLPGRTLHNAYEVEELVGMGAMGAVFRGRQIRLRRTVAIKVPKPDLAANEDYLRRFEREALTMAKLVHENVVQIFDVFVSQAPEEPSFIVMEFVEGSELETFLHAQERSLTVEAVCELFIQIARGIDAANARGVVHRDIKPSNIVVTLPSRVPKIMDFGIARVEMENVFATQDTKTMGTPAYMAPEQVTAKPVGPPCDIYAFAMMIFRLLARRLPYDCSTSSALLFAQVHTPPMSLDQCNPMVPKAAAAAVAQGLAKRPIDRPGTATHLATRLAEAFRPMATRPFATLFVPAHTTVVAFSGEATGTETNPPSEVDAPPDTPPPVEPSSQVAREKEKSPTTKIELVPIREQRRAAAIPTSGSGVVPVRPESASQTGAPVPIPMPPPKVMVPASVVAGLVGGFVVLTGILLFSFLPRSPQTTTTAGTNITNPMDPASLANVASADPIPPAVPLTPTPPPTREVVGVVATVPPSTSPTPRPTPSPTPDPPATPTPALTPEPTPSPAATIVQAATTPSPSGRFVLQVEPAPYSAEFDPGVSPHLTDERNLNRVRRELSEFVAERIERAIFRQWWSPEANALSEMGGPVAEAVKIIVSQYERDYDHISVKFSIQPSSVYWSDRALLRFEISASGRPKNIPDPNFRTALFRVEDNLIARARRVENRWRLERIWGNVDQLQELIKE